MFVVASEGLKVPMEHAPSTHISTEIVVVDESAYYLRRITDGDLVESTEAAFKEQEQKKAEQLEAEQAAAAKVAKPATTKSQTSGAK